MWFNFTDELFSAANVPHLIRVYILVRSPSHWIWLPCGYCPARFLAAGSEAWASAMSEVPRVWDKINCEVFLGFAFQWQLHNCVGSCTGATGQNGKPMHRTWYLGGRCQVPLWQSTLKQHCPGILVSCGYGQEGEAGGSLLVHSGAQPTAPSMQLHWCLQPARKVSPFWYILPLYSHVRPSELAENTIYIITIILSTVPSPTLVMEKEKCNGVPCNSRNKCFQTLLPHRKAGHKRPIRLKCQSGSDRCLVTSYS